MKINILISTINGGIENVKNVLLQQRPDVTYLISHQYTDACYLKEPGELQRPDVKISHIPGKGVTKSRNNAIRMANADIGVFADDDVSYRHEWFDCIKNTFDQHPDVDVAVFKIKTNPGEPEYKNFPSEVIEFKRAQSVGTVQIAFRINRVKDADVFFDERFGAGCKLLIGSDEQIFLHDCLKAKLKVVYFPEYIVQHPFQSTVKSVPKYDARRNRVMGGLDARMNGWVALPKAFLGTIKYFSDILKNGKNPVLYFFQRFYAALYVLFTKSRTT